MLTWLARRIVKDAWLVVSAWLLIILLGLVASSTGLGSTPLFERLSSTVTLSGTESAEGQEILDTLSGDKETVTLLVTGIDISSPAMQEKVASALADTHKRLGVMVGETNVLDPFVVPGMLEQPAARALAAKDLDGFLMVVTVDPNGEKVIQPGQAGYDAYRASVEATSRQVERRLAEVPARLRSLSPKVTGIVSDDYLVTKAMNDQVRSDLSRAELITLPLTLILMVAVFGGFLLAGMPLLGALASIATTLGALWIMAGLTDLQSFVVNIVSVIGLGLSIDYALLLTSRYREELQALASGQAAEAAAAAHAPSSTGRGRTGLKGATGHRAMAHVRLHRPHRRRTTNTRQMTQALIATMNTAGRTIAFSGLTVAVCMVGLALTGTDVLRSIALAGTLVVLLAIIAALTLVPATLVLMGARILRPSPLQKVPGLGRLLHALGDVTREKGVFSRLARLVQRVPWVVLAASVVILVVFASPVRHTHLLSSTSQMLPADSTQRAYVETLQRDYPATRNQDATLIIRGTGAQVNTFVSGKVAKAPGVTQVLQQASAGTFTVVYLDLAGDGTTKADEKAVQAIRDLPAPADTWVIGQAASQLDFRTQVTGAAPLAVGVVILAVMTLLFLMTGSLLVPLKALLTNMMSLAAALGVLTWIFQEGHGAHLFDFTPIGGLESYVVITAIGVGFGLAMDYEVFILARAKEFWDRGLDNDAAVAAGLQHSGRVVTSAAVVMVAVFLGFVSGEMLAVKEIGLALAAIVAIDATVVRMLLVPATMTLLGRLNWWAPAPLRRLYERYGFQH